MTEGLPISEASVRLAELVRRARIGDEQIILTDDDTPVAAIIGIDELRERQRAQDEADIALCRRSQASPGRLVPHAEVMAMLEAEDAAGRGATRSAGRKRL